ncbi:major histocompatibility complex class I-related gene protein-like isoform X3 [Ambystoma mexicanum]|uniref:major histocompatibility complex class I-related gene protein-like isoform X3 n=1 Tax=Ambystoma mexicanum TaxID=8296 RepID=UPI0037E89C3E
MRPGLCIPAAILFLIACSADGHTAPEVEFLSLQTGSSFYIPAMGVSPAEVYWNPSSPPGCTGSTIISVMQGVARPYTFQLLGRVDERLSNGSIVIRSLRPEDAGFYVVCAESSSTPVRTILLTVTGSPSLRYFVWSLSEEVPGIPRFSIVGFLDDIPILSYSSDSQKLEPRGPLVEKTMDPQEWERETDFAKEAERVMRAELLTVGNRRNHTEGLHTVQALIGCTLHTDLSMKGFLQVAYDGEDQFSFKKSKGELHMDGSSQYQWNSQHSAFSQDQADDREKECIKRLRKLLTNGEETLLMRVPPSTKFSRRKSGDRTLLICNAYGFYPREIEVKWVRNGVEMPSEQSPILPNPDGTFQIKTTVEVQEGDDNMYSCQVEHISLLGIVTVVYDEKQTRHRGCLVAAVVLVVGIAAAAEVIWVNKKHRQHQSLELQPCRGSSEEEAGQSPEPLHKHLQQNGDTAVVQDYPPTCLSTGEKSDHQETAPILLERNDPEGRNGWIVSNGASGNPRFSSVGLI